MLIISYIVRPVFLPRSMLTSYYALLIIAACLISNELKQFSGIFLSVAFTVSSCLSLFSLYTFNGFPRSPNKKAFEYLSQVNDPKSIIIHDNKLSFFPMEFYNRGKFREVFIRDEPGSSNDTYAVPTQAAIGLSPISDLQHGVSGYSAIYFIVYTETIKEYLATGRSTIPPSNIWRINLPPKMSLSLMTLKFITLACHLNHEDQGLFSSLYYRNCLVITYLPISENTGIYGF